MSDEITYPLELNEIAPGEGATRLPPSTRWDELPDGIHTGGAWEYQGKIWKPLDAKPYPNAECRVKTREADFLAYMGANGVPYFPLNWEVIRSNERDWLVRERAEILDKPEYQGMSRENVLLLEQALRKVNNLGWTLNDAISIAYDHQHGYFILDCSTAWNSKDNENWLFMNWAEKFHPRLYRLRSNGATAIQDFRFKCKEEYLHDKEWRWKINYTYASFNRPFSLMWASLPPQEIDTWHTDRHNWTELIPHTWIFSHEPLEDEYLERYELTLAYFKWMED